jgi:hypothetical protein
VTKTSVARPNTPPPDSARAAALRELARIAAAVERIERRLECQDRRLDEFFRVYLNARFPYGKPTDRWGRYGA